MLEAVGKCCSQESAAGEDGAEGDDADGDDGTTDNSEEAMLLLKVLAAHDKDVKSKVKNTSAATSGCCIM